MKTKLESRRTRACWLTGLWILPPESSRGRIHLKVIFGLICKVTLLVQVLYIVFDVYALQLSCREGSKPQKCTRCQQMSIKIPVFTEDCQTAVCPSQKPGKGCFQLLRKYVPLNTNNICFISFSFSSLIPSILL